MLVIRGSVETEDFILVVGGPELVVCAVDGTDEGGNIVVINGDDSVGVVAEVIAGDVGGAFLIAVTKKIIIKESISRPL